MNSQDDLNKPRPMWKIVLEQFMEHKMAVASALIILLFVLTSAGAPLISKITGLYPDSQNVFARYKPVASTVNISTINKERLVDQFIKENQPDQLMTVTRDANLFDFEVHPDDVLHEMVTQYSVAGIHQILNDLPKVESMEEFKDITQKFTRFHILGTDALGRDVFIRLVYGTRVSLTVGLMVAVAAGFIGLFIGSIAGYYGGFTDSVLMRFTDALLSLPLLVVLIVVSAIDLTKTPFGFLVGNESESIIKMVLILCLFSWMQVARLVRGSILSLKQQEFIQAARILGAKDRNIILAHIVPNVIAPLLVAVTLGIGNSILFEAALSFLGLGIQPPTPSWGNMLNNAQEMIQHAPTLAILPGVLILLTVISFNYIGDGLQDAIDPKSIKR
jgi:peptide/nickel transport system permease protein